MSALANEVGGHRVQRVPKTERQGRVHSSTVTVAVIGQHDKVRPGLDVDDVRVEYYSGTGAGGQHRNKHQNSCRIIHLPTGLTRSSQTRSRESSYREAIEALRRDLVVLADREMRGAVNGLRRDQVGTGERSDKRRTYRFQEDRVTDHVTGVSSKCSAVMAGAVGALWR